jgi:hypothetical protein
MAISDVLTVVLISAGILLFFVAWWIFSRAYWPDRVNRARQAAARSGRCFLVGILPFFLLVGLGVVIVSRVQPLWFIAAIILLFTIMYSHTGVSAVASRMGEKLRGEGEPEWLGHRRACWSLAGLFMLPVIGWFVFPLLFGAIGMGAMLLSMGKDASHPTLATATPPLT